MNEKTSKRIWYQSFVDPVEQASYIDRLRDRLRQLPHRRLNRTPCRSAPKPRADDTLERAHLRLRHVVSTGKIMRWEQEHVVHASLLPRAQ
jgi:hypothetical protein